MSPRGNIIPGIVALVCASGFAAVLYGGLAAAAVAGDHEARGTGADSLLSPTAVLRRALLADTAQPPAWPAFRLREQTLLVGATPDGPMALAGDPSPPAEFRLADTTYRIYVRDGPPPDSLAGMRLNLPWSGGRGRATVIPLEQGRAGQADRFLIHEAFHTFQSSPLPGLGGRFPPVLRPAFPDTSTTAVGLFGFESYQLARALTASSAVEARSRAVAALAVRDRRCARFSPDACRAERSVEQSEGSADYVTALLVDGRTAAARASWRDSLARALAPLRELQQLERWHFYTTGHAWLLLLERLGPDDWQQRVERTPPDRVLAAHLGAAPVDSLLRDLIAADVSAWAVATETADRLVAVDRELRDSVHRAFWSAPGVPVRVNIGKPTRSSVSWRASHPRRFSVRGARGELLGYEIGAQERTQRISGTGDVVTTRGAVALSRATDQGQTITVIASTGGMTASVDGRAVRLDRASARPVIGALQLDSPSVSVTFRRAELRVFADSVTIRLVTGPPARAR